MDIARRPGLPMDNPHPSVAIPQGSETLRPIIRATNPTEKEKVDSNVRDSWSSFGSGLRLTNVLV